MIGHIKNLKCPHCKKVVKKLLVKHPDYEVISKDIIGETANYYCLKCGKKISWKIIRTNVAQTKEKDVK